MTARQEKVRVFVALDLPREAKSALAETVDRLQTTGSSSIMSTGVRWVNPEGIHLTLKFLGDIDAALVDPLLDAMRQAGKRFGEASFPLHYSELGVFPNAREPRVLWAGIGGDLSALGRLQRKVDDSIADLGFAKEDRPFRPHLTLGRVRNSVSNAARLEIGQLVPGYPPNTGQIWRADKMHLIRSTRKPDGAIYDSLGSAPLA